MTVEDTTGWKVGDRLGIATTSFYGHESEEVTITSISA